MTPVALAPVALVIVGLVALQRGAELIHSERNRRALMAQGGVELGRAQHPLFVALHAAWLVAIVLGLPAEPPIKAGPLAAFVLLQAARIWVIVSLGRFWTTRIITLSDAPLVRRGPYRWVRHPNYWIVAGEIALLPLVFGETAIAVIFSILNAVLLAWRIRVENRALAPRRGLAQSGP